MASQNISIGGELLVILQIVLVILNYVYKWNLPWYYLYLPVLIMLLGLVIVAIIVIVAVAIS